jgi:hypothetical protein
LGTLHPPLLLSLLGEGGFIMTPSKPDSFFEIDLKIRLKHRIYRFSLSQLIKWLVPVVLMVYRAVALLRKGGP